MSYYLLPEALSAPFMVPSVVVDRHLKLASETQIKVLLFVLRNISSGIDPAATAKGLSFPESEVLDALFYWEQCGILGSDVKTAPAPAIETVEKKAVRRAEKPSRSDVAHRGLEDERVALLLREAQLKFGRNLKSNEASTLVWLYDDEGMDVSVILMLLQYALSEDKCNISFIERTAAKWIESGVETVADAEKCIAQSIERNLAWGVVQSAFGIDRRRPSEKELELSAKWVNEWKMAPDILRLAYDACIDQKAKLSFPYIGKILEGWHLKGYKTAADIKKGETDKPAAPKSATKKHNFDAYDLDLFEKMLDSED